jgi:peroxiredoxin
MRSYWTRQWAEIDPRVEPVEIAERDDGRVAVAVEQTVLDLDGGLIAKRSVRHVYAFRDGLVARMDVEE